MNPVVDRLTGNGFPVLTGIVILSSHANLANVEIAEKGSKEKMRNSQPIDRHLRTFGALALILLIFLTACSTGSDSPSVSPTREAATPTPEASARSVVGARGSDRDHAGGSPRYGTDSTDRPLRCHGRGGLEDKRRLAQRRTSWSMATRHYRRERPSYGSGPGFQPVERGDTEGAGEPLQPEIVVHQ